MITYFFENVPEISLHPNISGWLMDLILAEYKKVGVINYIFCDDEYLLQINQDFLSHDYYTDIITFNYVKGNTISADIFVSLPRIFENADNLQTDRTLELCRVMAHGILHLCGYNDETPTEIAQMRHKEEYYLANLQLK